MPVSKAVKPSIVWKKSGRISAVPNKPNPMMIPRNEPTENERNLKTDKSTIGCRSLSALSTNVTSATAATTLSSTIVFESNQSSRSPCSSTYCSDASPAVSSPSPIQSMPPLGLLM